MAKSKSSDSSASPKKMRPALTPENRENQLISLAVDLAEKQLREGTASSQVISHFLKLGSSSYKAEKEMLEKQKALIAEVTTDSNGYAKIENLKSVQRNEELLEKAIEAMRIYGGRSNEEE